MSERRMFSKSITESDCFLDMPLSAQALYFHLSMNADDEGFINNLKRIMRVIGAEENDFQCLVKNSFVIVFKSGICVIKHWKINNKLRNDRKRETNYPEEKEQLKEKPTGVYTLKDKEDFEREQKEKEEQEKQAQIESVEKLEKPNKTEQKPNEIKQIEKVEQVEEVKNEQVEEVKQNANFSELKNTESVESVEKNEEVKPVQYVEKVENFESVQMQNVSKDYASDIFDVLYAHNLPCCNGNLATFCMRDFRLALDDLRQMHLHSNEVIQAVKNYAEVIEMKRRGLSWWASEQDFYHFCSKKTILKFLPENFKLEDYLLNNKNKEKDNEEAEKIKAQMALLEQVANENN